MKSNGDGKQESIDPDQLLRSMDFELAQARAAREQKTARFSSFRPASFIFLFAVIVGAALAFYFVFSSGRLEQLRAQSNSSPSPTASASP